MKDWYESARDSERGWGQFRKTPWVQWAQMFCSNILVEATDHDRNRILCKGKPPNWPHPFSLDFASASVGKAKLHFSVLFWPRLTFRCPLFMWPSGALRYCTMSQIRYKLLGANSHKIYCILSLVTLGLLSTFGPTMETNVSTVHRFYCVPAPNRYGAPWTDATACSPHAH